MEKILFIHIPKTAGATFRSILLKNISKKQSFVIHDLYPEISLRYLNKLSDIELKKYNLIAGHGSHYLLKRIPDYKSILYLRDPVKQIISSFYHIKRSSHSSLHKKLQKIDTLEGYYDYLREKGGFNLQTNYLSRTENEFIEKKRFKEIGKDNYAKAFNILKNTDYVFTTDQFDESLLILKKELGLKKINYISRNLSASRSTEEKNIVLIEKIKKEQIWDYKLYEYGKARFKELMDKHSYLMEEELNFFRSRNKQFNNTIGRVHAISKKTNYIIERIFTKEKKWLKKPQYDK